MQVFEITPMGAVRMTQHDHWKPAAQKYFESRDYLRLLTEPREYVVGDTLAITFCLPMAASWSAKKRNQSRLRPCQSRPDTDNMIKWWTDCLAVEDKHIHQIVANKIWSDIGMVIVYDSVDEWKNNLPT